ncbi:MAG: hypothetical protein A2096_09815 [Spirochaetes bacterium GWF1_41_5]|nr:MAG: hypothetical protein A2096_09815 [Spirochaetes bacterium GWF1_41_5]HBE03785.1 hypothetical protein [Spirochaetia bacterium]
MPFRNILFSRLFLTAVIISLFFGGINRSLLRFVDDTYHAHLSKLIITSGSIFKIPHPWNSRSFYLEKTTFLPWLMSLGQRIFPTQTIGPKFFLIINIILCLFLMFCILKDLFSEEYAWLSVFILSTTQLFLWYARRAGFDASIVCYIMLSILCYYAADKRRLYSLGCGFFAGLAVLTKGVMGLWPPFIICVWLLASGQTRKIFSRETLLAVISFSACALPWHIIMYTVHGKDFLEIYLWQYQIAYFFEKSQLVNWGKLDNLKKLAENYWPYLPLLLYSLGQGINKCVRKETGKKEKDWILLLLIWILSFFIIFQIAHTKRYYFTLPAYAGMALLSAWYLLQIAWHRKAVKALAVLAALASIALWTTPLSVYLDQSGHAWQKHKALFDFLVSKPKMAEDLYIFPQRRDLNMWLYDGFIAHTEYNIINGIFEQELKTIITNKQADLIFTEEKYLTAPEIKTLAESGSEIFRSNGLLLFFR